MKYLHCLILSTIVIAASVFASCSKDDDEEIIYVEYDTTIVNKIVNQVVIVSESSEGELSCKRPEYLQVGDKVALISPSYYTPTTNVEKAAAVLRSWGLEPVIGENVGKIDADKYAGTVDERLADLRWALEDDDIKAIICNRGGYGAIQLVSQLTTNELAAHPKWLVGFSDITTLHGLLSCAGVMSIHGTMSTFLASSGGTDATSTTMRDVLMGNIPRYELPAHSQNITGKGSGTLVGGNICTFVPLLGSQADATAHDSLILFIEEIGESMHNIDRLFNMLLLNGVLSRCNGVVLGEFVDCGSEFSYASIEAMLKPYIEIYNIPLLCGFPAGHGSVNMPLVMGANVTIDVREDGSTLSFNIDGNEQTISTKTLAKSPINALTIMKLAGKLN